MLNSTRRILSRNVHQLRLQRGWSQEQLAQQCGLHRTYIGAVERAERNLGLDNLEKLALALNTTAANLLHDTTEAEMSHGIREARAAYPTPRNHLRPVDAMPMHSPTICRLSTSICYS